ncbi:MAG: copper chaperone PCu(A)C [Hyphomicrobiaceae bacterium]|nr:copper chaperone PCu(A)C [Hyphomicrobiaceae bacterium]
MSHKLPTIVGALALLLTFPGADIAGAHEYTAKTVTVSHPWARATPPGATVGAAYLEIAASKKGDDKLVGGRSEIAGRVEIHTHERDGDVMKMKQVAALPVPAGKSVVLKPSGDHVMLMDLKRPLVEGDLLKLTLTFEKAGDVEIEATVEPIGAKGPHGMDHQPGHEPDHSGHGAHKH